MPAVDTRPLCQATQLPLPRHQWGTYGRRVVVFQETDFECTPDGTGSNVLLRGGVYCSAACLVDHLTGDTRIPIDRDRPCTESVRPKDAR